MESGKIVKARRIGWVNWTLLTLLFIGIPSFVHADISDILLKFHPYITAEEEYSNNILLSPNATKLADYITRVTPGLRFSTLQAGAYGIDLDVSGGYTYYKKNHDFSYWNPQGRLDAWYAVTPNLTFRLRDYLIRSDAARENIYDNQYNAEGQFIGNTQPDQYLLSTQRGVHAIYIRNVVEPSIEYRFGRENLASLLYRNNIYRNKNPLFENSTENTINPLLNYWFDIRNGVTLEYTLTFGDFQFSDDLVSQEVRSRYTHRLDPKLSLFGEFIFINGHFKGLTADYDVYNPSLGIEYKFSPTLTGSLQGGYFWQFSDDDSETKGPFFRVSLIQTGQKTSYALMLDGGYSRDYFTAENLGFQKYYRAYGTINHRLTQRLSAQLTGSVDRVWYPDNRKDWIWDGRVSASYLLFRWLTIGLEGGHREARSTVAGLDYSEYSGIFRITLAQPGYQPGMAGGPTYR
jgi:hypothetical protein